MKQKIAAVLVAVALVFAMGLTPALAKKHKNNAGAVATGAIIGLAAAAIIGSQIDHSDRRRPAPQPYRPAAPYSPTSGVVCYPKRQLCIKNNGLVSSPWTDREFGW